VTTLCVPAIDAARELRLPAGRENPRLLDPVLPLDTALEVQELADAVDVGSRPVGHLLVRRDPERVELLLDQHADAADALEVVHRTRRHRSDAIAAQSLGPDRPQRRIAFAAGRVRNGRLRRSLNLWPGFRH